MIQIITYNKAKFQNFDQQYKISGLDEFDSFDDYKINIIDLSNENIWRYNQSNTTSLNNISDLKTLSKELNTVKKAKIIIVFPHNCDFKYEWISYSKVYGKSVKIKNILPNITDIISKNLFKIEGFEIAYSKNKTMINNYCYQSDFNFNETMDNTFNVIYKSENSDKNTAIIYNNFIVTTLNVFESNEHLENFILPLMIVEKGETKVPKWVEEINFYNDESLKNRKKENNKEIQSIQEKNCKIDLSLERNNKIKSILYTTGDELVEVVMMILDEILENDSSNFIDYKKEDFLIKKSNITFIGEIKGISSAISNKNVSQLDVHVQEYNDKISSDGTEEKVKGILIINHQRNKKISERNEVHKNQIDLAIRNDALIIESNILLLMYEKYLEQKLHTDEIIKLFTDKTGILCEDDIKTIIRRG